MSDDGTKTRLDGLETAVHKAAETIERLRTERDLLAARVAELEAAGGGPAEGESPAAWQEERREIRERVQKLTERLEALLDDR